MREARAVPPSTRSGLLGGRGSVEKKIAVWNPALPSLLTTFMESGMFRSTTAVHVGYGSACLDPSRRRRPRSVRAGAIRTVVTEHGGDITDLRRGGVRLHRNSRDRRRGHRSGDAG